MSSFIKHFCVEFDENMNGNEESAEGLRRLIEFSFSKNTGGNKGLETNDSE